MWLYLGSKISMSISNHSIILRASFTAIFITAVAQKYLLESSIYKYKYENVEQWDEGKTAAKKSSGGATTPSTL